MEGKVFIGAAEASDEVVFVGPNGTFGGVAAVAVGRDQLEIYGGVMEEIFEGLRGLVVESMELGTEATFNKDLTEIFEGLDEGWAGAIANGFG